MKPVLMSDIEPKPSDGAPAMKESVPFRSVEVDLSATMTGEPSGRIRSTGRFAPERSTRTQSPSSELLRRGEICSASKIVDKVRLSRTLAPAFTVIFSRKVGRKDGAE